MGKVKKIREILVFVTAMVMICLIFAGIVTWNQRDERAFAADEQTVITLQIGNPK